MKMAPLRQILFLACIIALPAQAAPLPVEAYGRLPAFADVSISTDGNYIAAIMDQGEGYVVGVYELPITADSNFWARKYDNGTIRWIEWANDERLLVSVEFLDHVQGLPIKQTRLLAMNYDGSDVENMVRRPKSRTPTLDQFQDNVLDMLPEDPDHILMAFSRDASNSLEPEVRKVNVHTGKNKLIETRQEHISTWYTDRDANVRIGFGIHDEKLRMILRDSADSNWKDISYRFQDAETRKFDDSVIFQPLGFDSDPNILYILSNHESDTASVYRYDIAGDEFLDIVYGRDDVDISGLEYDSTGRNVIGVRYIAEEPEVHYLEEDADARIREQISEYFDGAEVRLASATYDNTRWIISVSGDTRPRQYYLLDKTEGSLKMFGQQYPDLKAGMLVPMQVTSYKARDNVDIPAYISLPPGIASLADAHGLPFVALPHGGPSARDFKRFDFLAQFLASRGYAVLQMNFRGSTGYGTTFALAGHREWGQAMQDDVTDGVNWLVEQGYADAGRICAVGWSYGAYAALMGSVKTPDLYRCAVGIAGVYDLKALLQSASRYHNGRFMSRNIGRLWPDGDLLEENSPANNAAGIEVPVLLMHAADDRIVDINQSRLMRDALNQANKSFDYVEYESGGHSLVSNDRVEMLKRLEAFLAEHLGEPVHASL